MSHTKFFLTFVGNSLNVELQDLTNSIDDTIQTDATVTIETIKNKAGTVVVGPTFPLTMPHVAAGLYRVVLADTAAFLAGYTYIVEVKAVLSGGGVGRWFPTVDAKTRRNV